MSLRVQLTLLFAAVLALTMTVATALGVEAARRTVEEALRDRTEEMARSIAAGLELESPPVAALEPEAVGDRLANAVPLHRGLRMAELRLSRGGRVLVTQLDAEAGGPDVSQAAVEGPLAPPAPPASVERDGEVLLRVEVPVLDAGRRAIGVLAVEAEVSGARQIAAQERRVFLGVAAGSAIVLAIVFTLVLGPMLARPLGRLAEVMGRVEAGAVDVPRVPGSERRDEIGVVARGLEAMLVRLRGFSAELEARVEAATRDLARKNRTLAEVNEQLVAARRDLSEKERLAALGQISGTIAHELGNPLNALSARLQLAGREPTCPPALRDELAAADADVRRMTAIIRRFLDSARALTPAPEGVDVPALLDDVLSLGVSAEARGRVAVERVVDPALGRVAADPGLVRHVLQNLVANALDAMPGGGTLTLRAAHRAGELALSVADTGPGIPAEDRRRVFEPFYTTKAPGKGTGLGLAICREIAAALHGRLELESEPGKGAVFTLVFPAPPWREVG